MSENPKGWPDTDPYPYRNVSKDFTAPEELPDCDFVARDKEYAKTAVVEELGDYSYILKLAWQQINELSQEVKDLKDHIQWLNNVGGERLNMACGIDIVCRDMVIAKRKEKAKTAEAEAKVE